MLNAIPKRVLEYMAEKKLTRLRPNVIISIPKKGFWAFLWCLCHVQIVSENRYSQLSLNLIEISAIRFRILSKPASL